jgi:hypothetical protein
MAWWVPVAMMAGGYAMGEQQKREQIKEAARQRTLEAEKARWSPWTGVKPRDVREPSSIAAPMQGALTGLSMWQNYEAMQNQKEMNEAMKEMMQAKTAQMNTSTGPASGSNMGPPSPGTPEYNELMAGQANAAPVQTQMTAPQSMYYTAPQYNDPRYVYADTL